MSTALVSALRESVGYLCDSGYRQTARLMVAAADEIERLHRRLQQLEADVVLHEPRGGEGHLREIIDSNTTQARQAPSAARHHGK